MGLYGQGRRQWRLIATIETHASTADVYRLVACGALDIRVEPVDGSPSGFRWFNVLIDAGDGEQCYVSAARAVLRMVYRSVDAGSITEFRVVDGNQWLTQRHGGAAG